MINVSTLAVGEGQANCHVLLHEESNHALIIDPGAEAQKIYSLINDLGAIPLAILLTHTHYDHIGAVDDVRDTYDIPVFVSTKEKDWLMDGSKNLSSILGENITARTAEHFYQIGETLQIAEFSFRVLATPGHSPGGVSFVFFNDAFVVTGDALFAGGVGRTDLPGSSTSDLFYSIREKLFTLPEAYTIYPGHGESSTIGIEKDTNPFFNR